VFIKNPGDATQGSNASLLKKLELLNKFLLNVLDVITENSDKDRVTALVQLDFS
jgi:hypothetical protein